jgi:capsular exopolysaccharide synthesis family protein
LGEKVLLVDADLRIPTIHKKLRISNSDGLSSVLVGLSTFEESVQNIGPNLDIITAGPIPPNPSELLSSQMMDDFILAAEKIYDRIIIDSPPLGIVTDAVALGNKTAGVVLVVRGGKTTHDQVDKSLAALEFANTKVLGVIINGGVKKSKSYKSTQYGR